MRGSENEMRGKIEMMMMLKMELVALFVGLLMLLRWAVGDRQT